ncbi:MAG: AraC family transcriptional regulator [Clostridiales Family XIII bacterium]|jgi:YesN/AraC family two-component response regulator|nr:AraC family transcriptional regulator [Clostridiales Family XIII bacterium]
MNAEEPVFGNTKTLNQIQTAHLPIGNYDFIIYHVGCLNEKDFGFWHSHACFELYYVKDGRFNITIGDSEETLSENDLLFLPPETIHYVEYIPDEKKTFFSLIFDLNPLKSVQPKKDRRAVEAAEIDKALHMMRRDKYVLVSTAGETRDIIRRTFREIQNELDEKSFGWNISLNMLCLRILIQAIRQIPLIPNESITTDEKANLAIRCIDYIRIHYAEDITVDSLATDLFISSRHVNRVFNKMFKTTFSDILRTFRMDAAKNMIKNTDLANDEIAKKVGLGTEQTFKKLFKETERITVNEYRRIKGR